MKKYNLLSLMFAIALTTFGADYYWVNNGGNWSDYSNHWATTSGGSTFHTQVPTSNDNVFFDENSFSLSNQTVLTDETNEYCNSMDWSGVLNTPKLQISNELYIYGSLTFSSNMTSYASKGIYFKSDTIGNTITSAGVPLYNDVVFDGIGGEWTLTDSLQANNYGSNTDITIKNGILKSGGHAISAQKIITSGTGTTDLTGSNVYIRHWSTYLSTKNDLTNTTLYLSGSPNSNGNFTSYGTTHNVIVSSPRQMNVKFTTSVNKLTVAGNGACLLNDDSSIDSVIVESGKNLIIGSSKTLTINNYLSSNGDCSNLSSIKSSANSSTAYIVSSSTVVVNSTSLQDISVSGDASFVANSSYDLGGNSGWMINQPTNKNYYWIGNSGNWSDANHWALSSGGSSSGCSPGPNDNVYFDANSFSTSNQQVTLDLLSQCKNMDWSGVLNTPKLQISNELYIYGSLTFSSNMTSYASKGIYFKSDTIGNTITSAGVPLYNDVVFDGIGGEWTLTDSLQANNYGSNTDITIKNGILKSGGHAISAQKIITSGTGTTDLTGSNVYIRHWSTYLSTKNDLTNTTLYLSGSPNSNGNFTSYGTTHNVIVSSPRQMNVKFTTSVNKLTVAGNGACLLNDDSSIDSVIVEPGSTLIIASGKTLSVDDYLSLNGTSGHPVQLKSNTNGVQGILSQQSKDNCFDYLYLKDINAIGSSTYNAGLGSDNISNNTGWSYSLDRSCFTICLSDSVMQTVSACHSAIINGNTYTSSQLVVDSLKKANGCDSIVITDLVINSLPNISLTNQTICQGETAVFVADTGFTNYIWSNNGSGISQTTSGKTAGVYTVEVTDSNGCKDTTSATLLVNNLAYSVDSIKTCFSVLINGTVYTTSKTVVDTLAGASSLGCDSIATTYLTFPYFSDTISVLVHDTILFTINDTVVHAFNDTALITINDTIVHAVFDTALVTINDTVVYAVFDTALVTISDTIVYTVNDTNYVTINNFVDVYDTLVVDLTGIVTDINTPFNNVLQVRVYPNPASQLLFLEVLDTEITSNYTFEVINLNGQSVLANGSLNSNITTIDLSPYSGGTYYVKFYDQQLKMVNLVPIVINK